MAYYKSEDNNYCSRKVLNISDSGTIDNITVPGAKGPYRLANITGAFQSATTGTFYIKITKSGVTSTIAAVPLDNSTDFIVTGADIWLDWNNPGDYLTMVNDTQAAIKVVLDFTY